MVLDSFRTSTGQSVTAVTADEIETSTALPSRMLDYRCFR